MFSLRDVPMPPVVPHVTEAERRADVAARNSARESERRVMMGMQNEVKQIDSLAVDVMRLKKQMHERLGG